MRARKLWAVLAVITLTAGVGIVAMGGAPTGAAETSGYTVIWSDGGCQLATIDLATAAVTPIGATSQTSCVSDLAVAPDGTVYGILAVKAGGLDANLVRFDTSTGAATTLGAFTGNFTESFLANGGITFGADDSMLVTMVTNEVGCDSAAMCLYRVDPATRVSTLIGNSGRGDTTAYYLTAACNGTTLSTEQQEDVPPSEAEAFGSDVDATVFNQRIVSWNTSTGVVTPGADLDSDLDVSGIEFDRVTGTLYLLAGPNDQPTPIIDPQGEAVEPQIADSATLYTVDIATGAVTPVADVTDSELVVDSLGIPGRCTAPAIDLQPTFTG